MSDFDKLLQDVIDAAEGVTTAYEWGKETAHKELRTSVAALRAELEQAREDLRQTQAGSYNDYMFLHGLYEQQQGELEQARQALRMVEWHMGIDTQKHLYSGRLVLKCPWCKKYQNEGHAEDCARQKGLGLS